MTTSFIPLTDNNVTTIKNAFFLFSKEKILHHKQFYKCMLSLYNIILANIYIFIETIFWAKIPKQLFPTLSN